jgi:hypothetical protein
VLGCQGRPRGLRDGVLLGGVRLEACEIVEEAQCLRLESSGFVGDHRHEPVVVGLKPLVTFGHLGAAGPVERVLAGCMTVKSSVRPAVPVMLVGYSDGP